MPDADLKSPFEGIDVSDLVGKQPPGLKDIYESVAGGNPEEAAKVIRLSQKTGEHPSFVYANQEAAQQAAEKPTDDAFAAIEKEHPVAAKFLSDPRHMAVSHDDLGNLLAHERLTQNVRAANSILDAAKAGFQRSTAGMWWKNGKTDLELPPDAGVVKRLAAQVGALAGDFPAMVAGEMAGNVAVGVPSALAGGIVGGALLGPAGVPLGMGAAGTAGALLGGGAGTFAMPDAVREYLREHYAGEKLSLGKIAKAGAKGAAVGALTAGAGAAAAPLGTAAKLGAEVGTMTAAGAAVEKRAPTASEFAENMILVGGMHGVMKLNDFTREKYAQAQRTELEQNFYRAMGDTAAASKLRERLPEAHKALLKELTNGTPVENVHVPVEAWDRYFQGANVDPEHAAAEFGIGDTYAEAKATGQDVKVPLDTWVNKLVGTKHYEGLAGDVKFDPDGMTPNQIQERNASVAKQITAEQEKAGEAIKADAALRKAHESIMADVKEQLKSAEFLKGKGQEKALESNARLVADHYVSEGIRRGIEPLGLYKSDMPRILSRQAPVSVVMVHHGETGIDSNKEPSAAERERGVLPVAQTHGEKFKDQPLNDDGKKQVADVAEKLKGENISKMYSGTSERVKETARAIGPNTPDPRFAAIDIADKGGMPVSEFKPILKRELKAASQDPNYKMFGKETFPEFQARNINGLQDIASRESAGGKVGLALNSDSLQLFKLIAENGGKPIEGEQILKMADKEDIKPADVSRLSVDQATGRISMGEEPLQQGRAVENAKLYALHNLNQESLKFADEFGGLAVPSMAVTKHGIVHEGFGGITLIGTKDLADPEKMPVFSTDAYSRRFPEVMWPKVRVKEATAFADALRGTSEKLGMPHDIYGEVWDYLVSRPDREKAIATFSKSATAMASFLNEKGEEALPIKDKDGKTNTFATRESLGEKIGDRKEEFEEWARKKIAPLFAEPSIMLRGKKVPFNLENVVESMTGRQRGQEKTMTFGPSATKAATARRFKTMEEMKAASDRIVSREEGESAHKDVDAMMEEFRDRVIEHYAYADRWSALDDAQKALAKAAKSGGGPDAVRRALASLDFNTEAIGEDAFESGAKAIKAMKGLVTEYFEAKPQRAVHLGEFAGAVVPENAPAYVKEILDKNGIPFRTYGGTPRETNQAAVVEDFVKELSVQRGDVLFQPGEAEARGFFDAQQKTIGLMKGADASTFMHESAHAWLQSSFDFVKSGQADAGYLEHWDAAKKWLGVTDEQTKLTRDQHEKFARGFEKYLLEGEAPSEGLRGTFARFRKWLTQVYKSARGINAELTPEIRGFMDRMLATDEAIQEAAKDAGYKPSEVADLPESDPVQAKRIKSLEERAHDAAVESLLKDQLAAMRKGDRLDLETERQRLTEKAEEEARQSPLYDAVEHLRKAIGIEQGTFSDKPVYNAAQKALEGTLDAEKQAHFEAAAEVGGFDDGKDLASAILNNPNRADFIKKRVDEGLSPLQGPKDAAELRQKALEAVHANRGTELLALEQQMLQEMTRGKEIAAEVARRNRIEASESAKAAREQAKMLLARKSWREATAFRPYITAERNAAARVSASLANGDFEKAAEAKQQQMLNHALASEAMKNKADVGRKFEYLQQFAKRGQDLKGMPYGFAHQIDAILESRGLVAPRTIGDEQTFTRIAEKMDLEKRDPAEIANATGLVKDASGKWQRESLQNFVARVNDENYALQLPQSVMGQQSGNVFYQPKPDMTLSELRDVYAAVRAISGVGKGFERWLSAFQKGDIRTNAKQLKDHIEANIGRPYGDVPALGEPDLTRLQKAVNAIKGIPDGMISDKVNLLTLAEYLDMKREGGRFVLDPDGPAKNNIYRPLERAWNDESVMRAEKSKALDAIREKFYTPKELKAFTDPFDHWEVQTPAGLKRQRITKEGALVLLLNRGTESNLDRLTRGFGIDEPRVREITDKLDERDHKFAQAVWDYLDEFWPHAKQLEMDVKGIEPTKVQARAVETPYGKLKGGYYPLAYDFEKSADAYKNALDRNALFKQFSTAAAHTEQGHLQQRVDTLSRPVRLDFSGMFNHLDDVIHDITHRKAVIDVARFLNQPDAKAAITNAIGLEGYRKMGEDLKAVASDQSEFLTPNEQKVRWFRFATTFSTLAYRAVIFPRRITEDVMNSFREVPYRNLAGSIADTAMGAKDTREFVRQNSVLMRDRQINRERDLIDMAKQWRGEQSKIKMFAFLQDTIADQAMSYPVWNAVYKANLEQYGHEKAATIADESIVKTFGSGRELDKVLAQRGGELSRIMSMYYSWHSMMFNRAWLQGKIAGLEYHENNYGKALAIMASTTATTWVLPAAIDIFWSELFRNSQQNDEEAQKKRMLGKAIEMPFSYFPLGRSVAAAAIPFMVGERAKDFQLSPIESAAQSVIKTAGTAAGKATGLLDRELNQRDAEDAARAASVLLGYPNTLNTWAFNYLDWLRNEGEATWRDLFTRRTEK